MSYEMMVRETDEMIRGVMMRQQIGEILLWVLVAVLAGLVVWRWIAARRADRLAERLAEMTQQEARDKGLTGPWVPVVSDTVQVIDGVEYRRMLPPKWIGEEEE